MTKLGEKLRLKAEICHRGLILYLLVILLSFSKVHKSVSEMMGHPL